MVQCLDSKSSSFFTSDLGKKVMIKTTKKTWLLLQNDSAVPSGCSLVAEAPLGNRKASTGKKGWGKSGNFTSYFS